VKVKKPAGEKTAVQKIVEIITRSVDPDQIILFGSRARKDNTKQSDYDICVIKRGIAHRRKLAMQLYRDLYGVGVPVDVIVETPETFKELKDNPFMIYHDIARQGRVIYEKPAAC
jgi:predicted nucleotidyltransferase